MLSLLAVACPPLAVLAMESPTCALANLGLTLMGYFPGMIHAWNVVEQRALERRYDAVLRALDERGV